MHFEDCAEPDDFENRQDYEYFLRETGELIAAAPGQPVTTLTRILLDEGDF